MTLIVTLYKNKLTDLVRLDGLHLNVGSRKKKKKLLKETFAGN